MAELALSLTGFDATNGVPGIYAQTSFGQGTASGDLGPRRVLVLAPKSGGTITVDTQIVQVQSEDDAIDLAGAGSPAHRMLRAFFAVNKSAEVWLLCPTAATGSAAVDKIVIATTAAANGVLTVTICNEDIDVPIVTGDTATVIGDNLEAAIVARTHLPVTAENASGTVTLTGKIAGVVLNSVRYRAKIVGTGVATTVVPTVDTALGASGESGAAIGVGVISMTAALATILPRRYDAIILAEQSAAAIDALMDQVEVQAEASTGFRQKVYVGAALTPSAATTLASGTSMNRARVDLINEEQAPIEHYLVGTIVAGAYLKHNSSNPSYNFDGYGTRDGQSLPGMARPYNDAALPTMAELKSMVALGVTAIGFTDGGAPYVVRAITTKCLTGSNVDYRVRDAHIVTVTDRFTADLLARIRSAPWTKVTQDPTGSLPEPGAEFATPRRMKTLIEQLAADYRDAGHLDPAKYLDLIAGITVGTDPVLPSRLNTRIPLYSAILLHQHAVRVAESSAAT